MQKATDDTLGQNSLKQQKGYPLIQDSKSLVVFAIANGAESLGAGDNIIVATIFLSIRTVKWSKSTLGKLINNMFRE